MKREFRAKIEADGTEIRIVSEGNENDYISLTDIAKRKTSENHISRSMSRVETPTDNPIIESLNGWIKAELITDFRYWEYDNLYDLIDEYVFYFNNIRPAYALQYKSPVQYRIARGFE